jgi:ketosteroid isomerase-like protein
MPEEIVEVVRRSFDAWNSNDWEALEELYDPDAVAQAPDGWPEPGVIEGFEAVREQFARNKDSWEEEHVEIDEIRELGPDRVLAHVRWVTKGKASGLAFETPVTELLTVRGGRITRAEFFLDRARALEAAGVWE